MASIALSAVHKTYDSKGNRPQVLALSGIDLRIKTGEYVAIMGPSGSGKTTLFNVMGCLYRPTKGSYFFKGLDITGEDDDHLTDIRLKHFGFVFKSFQLIDELTVLENIVIPMFYFGLNDDESHEKAEKLAGQVGLLNYINFKPHELSGEQKQRAAIARALANDASVIFADEPTGNLDYQTKDDILALLEKQNEAGKTLIIVTYQEEIARRALRTIHMFEGQIISDIKIY